MMRGQVKADDLAFFIIFQVHYPEPSDRTTTTVWIDELMEKCIALYNILWSLFVTFEDYGKCNNQAA